MVSWFAGFADCCGINPRTMADLTPTSESGFGTLLDPQHLEANSGAPVLGKGRFLSPRLRCSLKQRIPSHQGGPRAPPADPPNQTLWSRAKGLSSKRTPAPAPAFRSSPATKQASVLSPQSPLPLLSPKGLCDYTVFHPSKDSTECKPNHYFTYHQERKCCQLQRF